MANISNVQGNVPLLKKAYKKHVSLGEKVTGEEFMMKIEGYDNLSYLVQTTQLPAIQRENIESYGPLGVKFNQQGRYINAQDVSVTFVEVVSGEAYKALRDIVKNKKYVNITIGLVGESKPTSNEYTTVKMEDCWIELEGADLSVEDGATAFKPSGTIHTNWIGWLDDEQASTISME